MRKLTVAAAAALAIVSSAAFAAVSFDSSTGTGFVGKGDIQLLYGWNNAQLQRNASGVTFNYNTRDTYDVTCEWETVTGGPHSQTIYHDITVPKHTSVAARVGYDPRVKSQITGFILNGFGTVVTDGTVPTVGDACPGNNPGTVTLVTPTGSTGGLTVSYGGTTFDLPNTPVI